MQIFFKTCIYVEKFAYFHHQYQISVEISYVCMRLIVLMTGLTNSVTSVHLSAICAHKQQYVPRFKIYYFLGHSNKCTTK